MHARCILLSLLTMFLPIAAYAQDQNAEFLAAASRGDAAAVKSFLDRGVDVNAKTRYGATALSYASDKGHAEVVKLLLERGADPNVTDSFYGETPLGWALMRSHTDIIKLLIGNGANGKERVLIRAVRDGDAEIVKMVLERGGLTQETLNGSLIRAKGKAEIVELLRAAGAVHREYKIDAATLKNYAGTFRNEQVGSVVFEVNDGSLRGRVNSQDWFTTVATDKSTFYIIDVDALVVFDMEGDKVTGFTLKQSGSDFVFKRVDQKQS